MKSTVRKKLIWAAFASAGLIGLLSILLIAARPPNSYFYTQISHAADFLFFPLIPHATSRASSYPTIKTVSSGNNKATIVDDYVNLPATTADLTKDIPMPEGIGISNDVPINYSHWVLLSILKSRNIKRRNRAIDELARQRRWNDAECRVIAQALDPENVIRLARTYDCDPRLFLPPPSLDFLESTLKSGKIDKLIKSILKDVALSLDECSSCANFYTNMSIRIRPDKSLLTINELDQMDKIIGLNIRKKKKTMLEDDVIKLKAILNNIKCGEKQAKPMLESGLLIGLHHFRYKYPDNPKISALLSQILASISMYHSLRSHLNANGWIRVITEYSRDQLLEISLPAHKALANLDPDRKNGEKYGELLYLLSPLYRDQPEPNFDIVFIHGLVGSVYKSWRQGRGEDSNPPDALQPGLDAVERTPDDSVTSEEVPTRCWPKDWLAKDVGNLRILAMDYPTALSKWRTECDQSKETLKERANQAIMELGEAGVGSRPIIWVAHSMGGLMIKQMLLTCSEAKNDITLDEKNIRLREDILHQTKGIVFYSVPHRGSNLDWIERKNLQKLLLLTTEVIELQKGSPVLMELHDKFMRMINEKKPDLKFLSFAETCVESKFGFHPMVSWKGVLVHDDSLQFETGPFHKLNIDHAHTCKPRTKADITYAKTLDFITNIILEQSKRKDEYLIPFLSFPIN